MMQKIKWEKENDKIILDTIISFNIKEKSVVIRVPDDLELPEKVYAEIPNINLKLTMKKIKSLKPSAKWHYFRAYNASFFREKFMELLEKNVFNRKKGNAYILYDKVIITKS